MNDNIISNIISKTYFTIISFFIFIFLILFSFFITLQHGLFIQKIQIQDIELRQLYIKWDKKIDISLKEFNIRKSNTSTENSFSTQNISKYVKILSKTTDWFASIVIEKLQYENVQGSFKYVENEKGFFRADTNTTHLNASLYFQNEKIVAHILSLADETRDVKLSGHIYLSSKDETIYTKLNLKISDEADLDIYATTNTKKINYKILSNKNITSIKDIITMLHLPKHLQYWTYEAIAMKEVKINNFNGFIEYGDFKNAYKHLTIQAVIQKLAYKFNPKLDAITSADTLLQLSEGILYIYPHNASIYKMNLDKSWLTVDFTQKEELLTLNLSFNGIANHNILKLLKAYKIKLPFVQNSGILHTDLTLKLWLQSLDVDAQGIFTTKKANIDYLGLNIDIYDAQVLIQNNDIIVEKMKANYKDIAKADVKAHYNAKSNLGKIKFLVNEVHLGKVKLQKQLQKPLYITYNIIPGNDTINVNKSLWSLNKNIVYVDKMQMSLNMHTLMLQIPSTLMTLKDMGHTLVSGVVDLNTTTAALDAMVLDFEYDGIELSEKKTPIKVTYDKNFSFASKNKILFSIVGTPYTADKVNLDIIGENLYLKHTLLHIGKYISTKIYAKYNFASEISHISLNNFLLVDPNTKQILYENKKILLSADTKNERIKIHSKELEADFLSKKTGWKLYLNSVDKITRHSKLLAKYHVKDGTFNIYKNKKDAFVRFKSKVSYPYKILVKSNKLQTNYSLQGKIYQEEVSFSINNIIHVVIKDKITIDATNSAININEVLKAIAETNTTTQSHKKMDIVANFTHSYLYLSKNRKIIYDTIDFQSIEGLITANLNYNDGHAHLRLKQKKFHLYGSSFNDTFMNKLFSLTHFVNGSLDFSMIGDINDYNGVFYIQKSTLKEYKVLNNILAFVNTVPSLITFSLPQYSKTGLYFDKSYVKFNYKNKLFHLSDIYLDSKELDILGSGNVDMTHDNLDLVLNLKTDLGSDFSKIPVVGYILLNGDSISTTLNVKGKLSNPEVTSLLAKEIIIAPFNIIKRALLLPYKLFK